MLNYIFTYSSHMPAGYGFRHFSSTHICILIILAGMMFALIRQYQQYTPAQRQHWRQFLALTILLLESSRAVILIMTHQFTLNELPLHLCGIGIFIIAWDAIHPNAFAREILYSLNLWGAFAALIFPDWQVLPLINVFLWQSFIIHALLITYPLALMVTGEFRPNWRRLWQPTLYLSGIIPIILIFNQQWHTNFWFLNTAAAQSPLAPIQHLTGSFYLPTLILCLIALWFCLYLPWTLKQTKVIEPLTD
ncbi:TIGR02206 family membrane protein [Weissella diestrammenae]|uniref:TIGR02206 family membrane protein n=1 Tax=Weissella diestrammenae TaxID=1162633 RepID=A0A7G9T776_9LACO|nr:TIGR02206 family membrane protein [Weissella diestrammenae]MCM0582446.1 TIGR02206 family membrane protein [Weissella diestrammenae]QNN75951.1 TIGR02206 family membrane protein [Weissella diestrammenae]